MNSSYGHGGVSVRDTYAVGLTMTRIKCADLE